MNDDTRTIRAYLRGDMQAFHTLYSRYERSVFFYIISMVHNHHTAEDIFQNVWIKIVDKLPGFSFKGTFKNWMYTIAHHTVIDHIRSQSRCHTMSLDTPVGDEGDTTFKDMIADSAPGIVEELSLEELHNAVRRAIDTLSESQKEVLLLRCDAGLKFKEIAEIVDAPLNTVLARMRYATKKLRAYIRSMEKNEDAA